MSHWAKLVLASYFFGTIAAGQSTCPNGASVPQFVLSPVVGPLKQTSSNLGIRDDKWEFDQHKLGLTAVPPEFHCKGCGIAQADDTCAWDINLYLSNSTQNDDAGKDVFAVEDGDVVKYGGTTDPGGQCNELLIAHPNKTAPIWWSGYLHMATRTVGLNDHVTRNTKIGTIGHSCTTSDHLHLVLYEGQNTVGGLVSRNTTFIARSCGQGNSAAFIVNSAAPVHPDGTFVKDGNDPTNTVYLIRGSDEHRFGIHRDGIATLDVLKNPYNLPFFSGDQFGVEDIITISSSEMNSYPIGGVYSIPEFISPNGKSLPDGRLIQRPDGEISIITDNGRRRAFAKELTFWGLGFSACRATQVSFTDYDAYPLESLVDGTLNGGSATLRIASTNPINGIGATVNPFDITNQGSGVTGFSLNYQPGTNVTITVPANAGSNTFDQWLLDGVPHAFKQQSTNAISTLGSSVVATTVTMDQDHTLLATYTPVPPVIAGFAPAVGDFGTTVTINGSSLDGATTVMFNGSPSFMFSQDSGTQITTTVPYGATTGPISITTQGGTALSLAQFSVVRQTATSISGFSPNQGFAFTGVSIFGTGFNSATGIFFNGISAQLLIANDSQINTAVPDGATTGFISVKSANGTAISTIPFTVSTPLINNLSPQSGSPGDTIRINGDGLFDVNSIFFNGTPAPITGKSPTQLVTNVPTTATTGPVSVTAPSGQGVSSANFTVTTAPFQISSYGPNSGSPGTYVNFLGSGFTGVTKITFGNIATGFGQFDDSHITATVPFEACSGPISLSKSQGQSITTTESFTIISPSPFIQSFDPPSGPPGTLVTLLGNGLNCVQSVTFAGSPAALGFVHDHSIQALVPGNATSGLIAVTTPWGTGISSTSFSVPAKDFSISLVPGTSNIATISAGQTATYALNLVSNNGFSGNLTFSCTGNPASSTCSISPPSGRLTSSQSLSVTITISTSPRSVSRNWSRPVSSITCAIFFSILYFGFLGAHKQKSNKIRSEIFSFGATVILVLSLIILQSCGGHGTRSGSNNTSGGTPSGTSIITVGATDGTIQHSFNLSLTVN